MGRDKHKRSSNKGSGRDGSSFAAIPWCILDCDAYRLLSHTARSLLMEFARQYVRDNNGRLLASGRYLSTRRWKSAGVIQRAKQELIDAGFIYETVKGHRPNKASWYAITWQDIDRHPGFDAGAFECWKDARSGYAKSKNLQVKNTRLIPSKGVGNRQRGEKSPPNLSVPRSLKNQHSSIQTRPARTLLMQLLPVGPRGVV